MAQEKYYKALEDFILGHEYDAAADALISMVRIAFRAGYMAAGGEVPLPDDEKKIDEIIFSSNEIPIDKYLTKGDESNA